MTDILNIFGQIFDFFLETSFFGIPILLWLIGFTTFSLIISFLKGKKNK